MRASRRSFSKPREEVDIAPLVFLAYTDITAAASRALFGLETMDRQYQTFKIPDLEGAVPACMHAPQTKITKNTPPMDPVQVISCRYEEKFKPRNTFIIINTHVPTGKSHNVAKALVDLCAKRYVMKLVILTSQRMDIEKKNKLFENTQNGMAPATGRSRLPDDTIVNDAFLSNLIQLCMVEGQPFSVVTAPAHRCSPGQANSEDGSLQLIRLFQNTIIDSCGLMFSEKLSTSLANVLLYVDGLWQSRDKRFWMYCDNSGDAQGKLMYA